MKSVPHWQWFMALYFLLVAVPTYTAHVQFKKKILLNKSSSNIAIYCIGVLGTAFAMHFITMMIYFKFIFTNHS